VAFTTGLPFIGFGFMDNAILIIAGDAIDTSLGVSLGISTLCAAAIGNIISDLAGVGCSAYIEDFCATTLKLPIPKLSEAQRQLRSVRMASQGGMAIGMTIGCLMGMIPLLFIDANKADRLREKARLERLYNDVVNEAKTLVEAESTCLYLRVDKDESSSNQKRSGGSKTQPFFGILPGYHPSVNGEFLYAMYYDEPLQNKQHSTTESLVRYVTNGSRVSKRSDDGKSKATAAPPSEADDDDDAVVGVAVPARPKAQTPHTTRVIPLGKGIVSRAVLTGTTWNIAGNLMEEQDFYPLSVEWGHKEFDYDHFRDCAVVPILDGKGRVIAVLEALNKDRAAAQPLDFGGFTDQDVEILMSLASHVSVSLQKIYQDGEGDGEDFGRLRDTIRILKEGKGIKRSITRRKSLVDTTGLHNAPISDGSKKKNKLFPD
jgi:tRNA-specific adenosine deaminase 1